ncbi:CDP-alcohol phosphatidyltransferase family protein [bacterium]
MLINWPNRISLLRIILVPVFIIAIINELIYLPIFIFAVCMFSDALDGFLARRFNQKTRIGTFLDPAGDKLLLISAYITLAVVQKIPWWVTIIVLSRDLFIVTGWLLIYFITDSSTVTPRILSKITTFFQMVTVLLVLFSRYSIVNGILIYLYYFTVFITILSGLDYLYTSFSNFKKEGMIC